MRVIGLDVHRTFAEVVFLEDGRCRSGGRVDLTVERLKMFGERLLPTDEVVLEATGNTGAIVRSLKPCVDPASYPHTSGVYNLMMFGGDYGAQEGSGTEPSVHEGVQGRSGSTGPERRLLGGESAAGHTGVEFIQLGEA
jgi:hypothetical protein